MNTRASTDCNASTNGITGSTTAMRNAMSLPSLRAPISSLHSAPGNDASPSEQNTKRLSAMLNDAISVVNSDGFPFARSYPEQRQ
mmetsp:Transcript_39786/g.96052  ORF Transcript_39786/g.96052 Transcript_39786/m.96052 type:complete len:85 (-) Transcript_39786:49-303(-)